MAVDRWEQQFVLPVQAKGGNDQLSVVQTKQDIACCSEKYPDLICRAISAKFIENHLIALFELAIIQDEVIVLDEQHYQLTCQTFNQKHLSPMEQQLLIEGM